MPTQPQISIIIVAYQARKELLAGLTQLTQLRDKTKFEVIILDNEADPKLATIIKNKFPQFTYLAAPYNLGFGAGNNLGVKKSSGKYLFFLNPDTVVQDGALDELSNWLTKHQQTAIVAPTLFDLDHQRYPQQGAGQLNLLTAVATFSIFHRLWPHNPWANKFWLTTLPTNQPRPVKIVPGTALMIRRQIFLKIGGWDEQFFMYFEEFDLCHRVNQLGSQIWQLPQAQVLHHWEASSRQINTQPIFQKSRFLYFKKHHGHFWALVTEIIFRLSKWQLLAISIVTGILILILINIIFDLKFSL